MVPPKYKFILTVHAFHKFSIMDRIKILLGYRSRIRLVCHTQHSAGAFDAQMTLDTTTDLEPKLKNEQR